MRPFVKLIPVFKDYIWGGTKLKDIYDAPGTRVAEAWILSAHPDGQSLLEDGTPFCEYIHNDTFPILIKMIDAREKLSVQVHPDDTFARKYENDSGKNEMWIVLDSEPGAFLYVGFNRGVDAREVRKRVENGTIEEVLNKVPTHTGDAFFMPVGTVHAIGPGNLILEVQQSSNVTYRLYDYNRRDDQGNRRPLHVEKALQVLDYHTYPKVDPKDRKAGLLATCKYFEVHRYLVNGDVIVPLRDGCFASVVCVRGRGTISRSGQTAPIAYGDSFFASGGEDPLRFDGYMDVIVSSAKE